MRHARSAWANSASEFDALPAGPRVAQATSLSITARAAAAGLIASLLASTGLLCAPAPALAQTAGIGERPEDRIKRIERQRQNEILRRTAVPGVETAAPQIPGDGSASDVKFRVERIAISQSAVLPPEKLRALLARFEQREVTLNDLNRLVRQINDLYQAEGFPIGFAILPPQKVEKGVVQIVLVEPRVDSIAVSNVNYTDPDYLRERIPLKNGDLIDVAALERALLIMARTSASGIQVAAKLEPGSTFGTSIINLVVVEPPRHVVLATVDNHGTRDTGVPRFHTTYTNAALTGRDDPLTMGTTTTEASRAVFGVYDTALSAAGTRLELQFSLSDGGIVDGLFGDLDLKTKGEFVAGKLKHPVFIDREWLVQGFVEGAYSSSETETGPLIVGAEVARATVGFDIFYYMDNGSWQLTNSFSTFRERTYDNIGADYGNYVKYNGALAHVNHFGPVTASANLEWQLTPDELLPSAEQFAMGGAGSLAAYEINQFNGDEGVLARGELSTPLDLVNQSDLMQAFRGKVAVFVFAEGGLAVPYRANGDRLRREDFASDVGAGLDLALYSGTLNTRVSVAQSLDDVHEPLLRADPKMLLEMTLRLEF